jgi:hypothetical protein
LANGAVVALVGAAYLVVHLVLPRLFAAAERAQDIGIFDPALGHDPMLARPLHPVRTVLALVLVVTGLAHVVAAALYRRSTKPWLTALVVLGAVSLVPTSIALALLALVALRGERERRAAA